MGQYIELYTCNATGTLQWIVEPIVNRTENTIIFSSNESTRTFISRGNIVGMLETTSPLISHLTILGDPSLPRADVVCLSGESNDTVPYVLNSYGKH